MSLQFKYLLQPILSAWSSTKFALSIGSFASNVAGSQCSGARTLSRKVYALASYKTTDNNRVTENIVLQT